MSRGKALSLVAFAPNPGETSGMKAKAVNRSLLTTSLRAPRRKGSARVAAQPLARLRPFLSHTLRLRVRNSTRG